MIQTSLLLSEFIEVRQTTRDITPIKGYIQQGLSY